jgi:uncharacterized cupredoxin-like copper-binding protein
LAVAGTAVAGFSFAGVATTDASMQAPLVQRAVQDVTNVTVHATEYHFDLSQSTAPAGTINFTVYNDGQVAHDFSIPGKGGTSLLQPGGSQTWSVNLTAGSYQYICTVGEHAIHGMAGGFTVTPSTSGTTTSATTTAATTTATTTTTPPPPPTTTVKVSEKEFKIILPTVAKKVRVGGKTKIIRVQKPVKRGRVRFVVKNIGKLAHNFVIAGQATQLVLPGKTETLDATLAKGKFKFLCSITGHAALGMRGTLVTS